MGALQLSHSRKAEMSKGQQLLLTTIMECVKNQKPLLFEDVIICYYLGVKKTLVWADYESEKRWGSGPHKEYDILSEHQKDSYIWNRKIRDLIKSWFVSAVGLLVIKGWLTVLPTIKID